jgi:hypothetical protein
MFCWVTTLETKAPTAVNALSKAKVSRGITSEYIGTTTSAAVKHADNASNLMLQARFKISAQFGFNFITASSIPQQE